MDKKMFIKSIWALKKQSELDREVSDSLGKAYPDCFKGSLYPRNHFLQTAIIELLQNDFNDNHQHSWIEYYIYELDFGRSWKPNSVTIKDKDFKLKTAHDLWDLLNLPK